ncbi:MAG: tetratricopeptide repeat protein [Caulobacteraceae bacterium]
MRLLARIGMAQEALDDAQYLLEAVLTLQPDYQAARHDYAQVLIKRQLYREADEQARRLLERDPGNLEFRALDATAAVGLGQHERAIGIYRALIEDAPGSWDVPLWMATR